MSTLDRPGGSALVVIDLQGDVLTACTDVEGVLARTSAPLRRAREGGTPVVHVQHQEPGLEPGTPGWQIAAPVRPLDGEPVVAKRFLDAFAATDLAGILAAAGVDRLVVAGAQSGRCVRTTAQRAAAEGYDVTLVADCHTTQDLEDAGQHLTGAQIVAHTSAYFATLGYPGKTFAAQDHTVVEL
ncbi:cysteine hydrolase family protein [Cellulomonas hominis]